MTVEFESEESSPLLKSQSDEFKKPWLQINSESLIKSNKKYGTSDEDVEKLVRSRKISEGNNDIKEINGKWWRRYIGIFLGIIASIFLSLTTLIAKLLLDYHAFTKSMFRFTGVFLPSIPLLIYMQYSQKYDVFESIWPLTNKSKLLVFGVLFIRAFFGCTASIFQFYALDYIDIGDVSLVSFTTPVFVTILAYFTLNEKIGVVNVLAALVTLLGIGIISRPPMLSGEEDFNMSTTVGVSLALGCMLFATVTYVALRWLRPVHYVVVTFFYGFYSLIECLICSALTDSLEIPRTGIDWLLAGGMATLAFLGQSCFTLALKFEEAGPISLIRSLEVPFTFLWQIIFLSDIPDIWSLVGAVLILTSVVMTSIRKWISDLPEDDKMRQRFRFLL